MSRNGWLAICDRCGFEFKSYQMRKTWDGLYVDEKCFEVRHPQDFVRGIPDKQFVPWTRPQNPPIFVPNNGPDAQPI
jgi:hypothetical protein